MRKLYMVLTALLMFCGELAFAQAPVKIVDGNGTERLLGAAGKAYNSGMTTLPSSDTALNATTTYVQLIFCTNIDTVDRTVSISDNQGTPKVYFNSITIQANTAMMLMASPVGIPFASGIRWSASAGSAVNCHIVGVQ